MGTGGRRGISHPPGRRASLVDAVMDLPEVQASARLEATVPLGDTELLERLRQRTHNAVTRPAGCTALVDADIPARSAAGQRWPGDLTARSGPAGWTGRCLRVTRAPGCTLRMVRCPLSLFARPGGEHDEPLLGMISAGVLFAHVRCRRCVSPAKTVRNTGTLGADPADCEAREVAAWQL